MFFSFGEITYISSLKILSPSFSFFSLELFLVSYWVTWINAIIFLFLFSFLSFFPPPHPALNHLSLHSFLLSIRPSIISSLFFGKLALSSKFSFNSYFYYIFDFQDQNPSFFPSNTQILFHAAVTVFCHFEDITFWRFSFVSSLFPSLSSSFFIFSFSVSFSFLIILYWKRFMTYFHSWEILITRKQFISGL